MKNASPGKPLCLAPWRALSIRPNGQVLPDGQFEESYGNINSQELEDILTSESVAKLRQSFIQGTFSKACQSCQKKEAAIGHSRRLFFEDKLREFNLPAEFGVQEPPDIQYLDLNLSNKCNLKCRMCSSHSSSAWVPEEKKLLAGGPRNFRLNKNPKLHHVDYEKVMATFKDPQPFRNLKHIALQGGEPLMEEKNLQLLQKFVDWGLAQQITIDLSTNGSILSKEIQELIPKFKSVDMYISIEAVGELYQYIRGGTHFSISDLERNLYQFRRIPNLNIFFAVTTSVYNILYLNPLLAWFDNIRQAGEEMVMSNTVVRPEYLSFHILPQKLKTLARLRLLEISATNSLSSSVSRRFGEVGRELIERNLQKELYAPARKRELIEQFLSFNRAIDDLRETSLLKVAPDLALLLDAEQLDRVLRAETDATQVSSVQEER